MKITAVGLAAMLAIPTIASADPINIPGTKWYIEPLDNGAGCVIQVAYEPSDFRLAFTSDGTNWTIAFVNANWRLPIGQVYRTYVELGGRRYYLDVRATFGTVLESGTLTLDAVRAFSRSTGFVLRNDRGVAIGSYSLVDSSKALTTVAQCGGAMREARNADPNPFDGGRPVVSSINPFERDS
jgi:hypothetical protein